MALLDSIDRRRFLKALASAGATGALAPQALLAETEKAPAWQNWSGNQRANPANLVFATSEAQLRQALRDSTGTIRPFGGSHSFSAVVPSDDTLVSLEALAGLRGQDGNVFTYGGGWRDHHQHPWHRQWSAEPLRPGGKPAPDPARRRGHGSDP